MVRSHDLGKTDCTLYAVMAWVRVAGVVEMVSHGWHRIVNVNEVVQYEAVAILDMLAGFRKTLWTPKFGATKVMPRHWRAKNVLEFFKKGNRRDPGTTRASRFSTWVVKVYTEIIDPCLLSWMHTHHKLHVLGSYASLAALIVCVACRTSLISALDWEC